MPTDETTKKEVLLIVDDDEDLRTQMKWGLSKEYRVVEAADRQSALTAFAEEQPDVVTLDLNLGGLLLFLPAKDGSDRHEISPPFLGGST